jgi:hypothetical protein
VLVLLLLVPSVYVSTRTIFGWDGQVAVELAHAYFGPERAQSLEFRFKSEELMLDKIAERPVFGWGGYGRSFVYDPSGKLATVPDSFWVITYGLYGATGLIAAIAFTWPIIYLIFRVPGKMLTHPSVAGLMATASLLTLWAIDNLVNSMPNPIFVLSLGGLCGLCAQKVWYYTPARPTVRRPNVNPAPASTDLPELAFR